MRGEPVRVGRLHHFGKYAKIHFLSLVYLRVGLDPLFIIVANMLTDI